MGMTHDELKALIAPYALGAVSPEEEREIRSHVMSCEECMQEAEGYSEAAAALALAVDEAPLPAGFEDAVLTKVAEERPAPAASPEKTAWWLRWSKPLVGVAAFSVAAVVVLAAAFLAARGQVRDYEAALPELVRGAGMTMEGAGGSSARIVGLPGGATLFTAGLDEAPGDRTYQLWLMECADPADMGTCDISSAGTFDVSGGFGVLETRADLGDYNRAAITVEPDGGSEGPTTDPVVDSAAA
jgi:anti-sigma-K factor RskA